jgi:hypothetical protein
VSVLASFGGDKCDGQDKSTSTASKATRPVSVLASFGGDKCDGQDKSTSTASKATRPVSNEIPCSRTVGIFLGLDGEIVASLARH